MNRKKFKHLLHNLKSTVETLFLNNKCNSINNNATSSSSSALILNQESLLRLHMSIEQIFNNGIRLFKQDVSYFVYLFVYYNKINFNLSFHVLEFTRLMAFH